MKNHLSRTTSNQRFGTHHATPKHPNAHRATPVQPIRITSGKLRGQTLISPQSSLAHPMGAREKLALFNMLLGALPEGNFANLRVLDAFSGSGALGIEALSRGAKEVVFIEKNPKIAQILQQNLAKTNLSAQSQVICTSVDKYVNNSDTFNTFSSDFDTSSVKNSPQAPLQNSTPPLFDLILADPPYDNFHLETIAKLAHFLAPNGILALSHPKIAPDTTPVIPGLTPITTRTYARAHLSLYTR